MFINTVLNKIQNILRPAYDSSFFLQKIDWLIGLNILIVIISSVFAQSDSIGIFAITTVLLSLVKLLTKTGEKFELTLSDKFLLLYFVFVIISVAGSSLFYLSLKGFFKTFTYLAFYVSVVRYLKDNRHFIKYIFLTYALCACYETFYAFLQNIGAVEEISGWQDMSHLNPEEVMTRVYGTLKPYNPNLFGGYMLSIIPAFIALPFISNSFSFFEKNIKLLFTFSNILLCFLAIIALVLTGCRGAYIGFFFELITLICISYKFLKPQLKKIFTFVISFAGLLFTLIIFYTASLRARILSIFAMRNDSSNSFRFNVYHSCIQMFKDNWLLGIGCGNQNFREIYGLYMKTGFDALSAYNIYLETAVESGIFALICFTAFLINCIYKAFKYIDNCMTNKSLKDTILVLVPLLSIIGILAHGFVDTVFFRPQIQFTFWIMIGIINVESNRKEI